MFIFFTIIVIAIGLSMDTFSMSLSYGMFIKNKKEILNISLLVGIFHFIMPFLGVIVGSNIKKIISLNDSLLIGILLLIISLNMLWSMIKKEEYEPLTLLKEKILFAFTVSIDSFTTGIGIKSFHENIFIITFIFFTISFTFTYIGLLLGNTITEKIGIASKFIGFALLLITSYYYLFY